MDHPRSRGVYRTLARFISVSRGSSPLARGLPMSWGESRVDARIIPARAGFTARRRSRSWPAPDHPRSRGVYPRRTSGRMRHRGSSPLARGLRGGVHRPGDRRRIIPARAGFTCSPGRTPRRARDHPRSRGVYGPCSTSGSRAPGSSPLARGLHLRDAAPLAAARIIPARAGFTTGAGRRAWPSPDHPRSRGVYPAPRAHSSM